MLFDGAVSYGTLTMSTPDMGQRHGGGQMSCGLASETRAILLDMDGHAVVAAQRVTRNIRWG